MDKLIVYHGSSEIIKAPIYGKGKTYNDYGQGFYCTKNLELAKEWACIESRDGFANKYELDMNNLSLLDLSNKNYNILNWLAILLDNRIFRLSTPIEKRAKDYLLEHFLPEYKRFDVIKGYRADDSYFAYARLFIGNSISLQQLSFAMHLGKLGEQIVLKSKKAFDSIKFIDYIEADNSIYYSRRKARDEKARESFYKELEKEDISGIFIKNILDERIESNDSRLQ